MENPYSTEIPYEHCCVERCIKLRNLAYLGVTLLNVRLSRWVHHFAVDILQ